VIRLDTGSSSLDCWPMALAALSAFEGSDSPASFVALVMEK